MMLLLMVVVSLGREFPIHPRSTTAVTVTVINCGVDNGASCRWRIVFVWASPSFTLHGSTTRGPTAAISRSVETQLGVCDFCITLLKDSTCPQSITFI